MTKPLIALAAALAFSTPLAAPLAAQEAPAAAPSPGEIVAQATPAEWVAIPASDLLVMTLAPTTDSSARQVVIQLMPAPFSQGWVDNIRTFARARWYDNISVNRVQDNYVVQWGDPNYDNPEATGETKPLPAGLRKVDETEYVIGVANPAFAEIRTRLLEITRERAQATMTNQALDRRDRATASPPPLIRARRIVPPLVMVQKDPYANGGTFERGWPIGVDQNAVWPVHCYGMVGVGRNLSPDTGSGAELYTVIGHAPRHLDRNIALVGRVIEGMDHLSSLPRGKGDLGFYAADEADKRTPILTVRVASDLPAGEQPAFEYLSTEGETFARYAEARANRRDPFFNVPAGGADICNIPVPVRRVAK